MLVQKLRLQRGWSQQQLSDLSGLSVRTIQRIENGQTASVESLKSLASVFEIDFSQLTSEPVMMDATATPQHAAALEEQLALAHVRKVKQFYLHAAKYVIVMLGLTILNLSTHPKYLWVIWPALGWGLGLLAHGAAVFDWLPFFGADWEKRQVEKRLGRPL